MSDAIEALKNVRSFVAVMCGRGPDATIPETVTTPASRPVKLEPKAHIRPYKPADAAAPMFGAVA